MAVFDEVRISALALALGANAVAIGKPIAFGLAGGENGVERTFTILKKNWNGRWV